MVLQERDKNILAVLCVAIVLCLSLLWTKPLFDQDREKNNKIRTVQKELKNDRINEENLKQLQESIEALKQEISTFKQQLPKTEKRDFLIKDLEALARANNIELADFMPKEAVPVTLGGQEITERIKKQLGKRNQEALSKGRVYRTTIGINSSGVFDDYKKFFGDLITYYRAVEVADIVMTRKGVSGGSRGEDKRFARKRSRGKDTLEDYKNVTLNVNFSLYAYTAMDETNNKD